MLTGRTGTIAGAATLVALGFLGSRILGAVRAIIIANEYGASADLDAFFVAQRLPELVFQLLAGATLAAAFIPVYARYVMRRGEDEAWRLASTVLNVVLLGTIALAAVMLVTAQWVVPALAPGLGEDTAIQAEIRDDAIFLTRVMLISPILFAVSGMIHRHPQRAPALPAAGAGAHALQPLDHSGRAAPLRRVRGGGAGDRGGGGERPAPAGAVAGADGGAGAAHAHHQPAGSGARERCCGSWGRE